MSLRSSLRVLVAFSPLALICSDEEPRCLCHLTACLSLRATDNRMAVTVLCVLLCVSWARDDRDYLAAIISIRLGVGLANLRIRCAKALTGGPFLN